MNAFQAWLTDPERGDDALGLARHISWACATELFNSASDLSSPTTMAELANRLINLYKIYPGMDPETVMGRRWSEIDRSVGFRLTTMVVKFGQLPGSVEQELRVVQDDLKSRIPNLPSAPVSPVAARLARRGIHGVYDWRGQANDLQALGSSGYTKSIRATTSPTMTCIEDNGKDKVVLPFCRLVARYKPLTQN